MPSSLVAVYCYHHGLLQTPGFVFIVSGTEMFAADPFELWKLRGGASVDQNCLSSKSLSCLVGLKFGEFFKVKSTHQTCCTL